MRRISGLGALKIINNPLLSDSDGQATTTYTRAVESMAREIALLHDLTRTIRREIRKADDVEDATPSILTDENGDDIEEALTHRFAADIQSQFPGLSDILRLRLAKSMVLRRKRIIYKRSCYARNPPRMSMCFPSYWVLIWQRVNVCQPSRFSTHLSRTVQILAINDGG